MTEQQQTRILRRLEILQRQVEREVKVLVELRGATRQRGLSMICGGLRIWSGISNPTDDRHCGCFFER
jgi:hypothetical protein